jgi:exonuclease III
MRIAGWNGRVLGNGPAIRGLLDLQKKVDPDILFISETKMDGKRLEWLRWKLGLTNMVAKDCEGQSGGLALFWRSSVNLKAGLKSRYHIDAEITEADGFKWRFTGIYGEPKSDAKEATWKLLRTIKHHYDLPWLCVGDFNEILYGWEKVGGAARPQVCMDRFKEALEVCALHDLGFVGDAFTWRNNSRDHSTYIKERLDRAVATEGWCERFPGFRVINEEPRHSDHRPVVVELDEDSGLGRRTGGPRPFRFEAAWLEEENCREVVQNAWEREVQGRGGNVTDAIQGVAADLKDWNKSSLGNLEKRIAKIKKELERCRRSWPDQDMVNKEHVLRFKLDRLEEQKDCFWKQRAHVNWLTKGDRNSKFFHSFASERRRNNRIKKLKNAAGVAVEGEEEMAAVITNYFQNLFTSNVGDRIEELLIHVIPRVTEEMNANLLKEFTEAEVVDALENIGDLKAPGPDGMPSIFYKKHWEFVGPHVIKEVLGVLNGGEIPENWNDTWVTLIPKVKNPEAMKDLRPISLCNVVYKLISKVLANRLKEILNEIVAPNQSAFVPGRLITDNILLAYEVTHHMQNKRSGAVGVAALKLDMSKAYDRVEWSFLEQMMRRLGFDERWISLIMKCCSTVKYRFKLNGSLTNEVIPSRGLRQGDPISPYLFLICGEAFSCLLNAAEVDGRLEGVQVADDAPSFNHLLFADDSLILLKVTEESARHLLDILALYESCSGQTVNIDKSGIVFQQ